MFNIRKTNAAGDSDRCVDIIIIIYISTIFVIYVPLFQVQPAVGDPERCGAVLRPRLAQARCTGYLVHSLILPFVNQMHLSTGLLGTKN